MYALEGLARPTGIGTSNPCLRSFADASQSLINQSLTQLAHCKIKADQGQTRLLGHRQAAIWLHSMQTNALVQERQIFRPLGCSADWAGKAADTGVGFCCP